MEAEPMVPPPPVVTVTEECEDERVLPTTIEDILPELVQGATGGDGVLIEEDEDEDEEVEDDEEGGTTDLIEQMGDVSKVLVLGAQGVGKTTLTQQLLTSEYLANSEDQDYNGMYSAKL